MRIAEYLGLTLLVIVIGFFVFKGIEKAINHSVNQTSEQIRSIRK